MHLIIFIVHIQFVYPIFHSSHYYVISINVKNPRFDILDNSAADVGIEEKYGNIPSDLVSFEMKFLDVLNFLC